MRIPGKSAVRLCARLARPSEPAAARRLERVLAAATVLFAVAAIIFLTNFKVMDRDFWWHVKAGDVMLEQKSLIRTEPFAYTRAGQPYLATYEWLAQIILSRVFHWGGPTGVILFRMTMVVGTFLVILAIDPRRLWPNGLLAVWGAQAALIGFLERPQLFTFLLFSLFLALGFRYLETSSERAERRILFALVFLEILWVNLHGAAAVLGVGVGGALLAEALLSWARERRHHARAAVAWARVARCLWGLAALSGALFVSPNGVHVFTYLWNLLHDQTIAFIYEWQPRPFAVYVKELGPFWVMAFGAIIASRRRWLFATLALTGTAVLSLRAVRHEMLFVFTAIAVAVYELRYQAGVQRLLRGLARRWTFAVPISVVVALIFGASAVARSRAFTVRDQLHGFGAFDLARGSYDFLEREGIEGRMFNTYGIGGYLLYRGHPDRKVYIDGRNVDHGYAFMEATFLAGKNPEIWRKLEERFGFAVALIDYDAIKREEDIPYSEHLGSNSSWILVYLDDWVAVYVKDVPEHRGIIERNAYRFVTPEYLEFGALPESAAADGALLDEELARVSSADSRSVKAHVKLATRLRERGRQEDAARLLAEARARQPRQPEVLALVAALHTERAEWDDAARAYGAMLAFAGDAYPDINYAFIADVFEKAGRSWRARIYRLRAKIDGSAVAPVGAPVELSDGELPALGSPEEDEQAAGLLEELASGTAEDVVRFNGEGIAYAEAGRLDDAEESFLRALALQPSAPLTLNNLGALYVDRSDLTQAREYLERAVTEDPDYADARYNLALVLLRLGERERAASHLERARALGRDTTALESM